MTSQLSVDSFHLRDTFGESPRSTSIPAFVFGSPVTFELRVTMLSSTRRFSVLMEVTLPLTVRSPETTRFPFTVVFIELRPMAIDSAYSPPIEILPLVGIPSPASILIFPPTAFEPYAYPPKILIEPPVLAEPAMIPFGEIVISPPLLSSSGVEEIKPPDKSVILPDASMSLNVTLSVVPTG